MFLNGRSRNRSVRMCATALVLVAGIGSTTGAAQEYPITAAEQRLFLTDHLANLSAPASLEYRFERRGSIEQPLDDSAELQLRLVDDRPVASVRYLSGDNQLQLPAVKDVEGNPILLHFLERDVREMTRLTGGATNYYRKRIRMALANGPPLKPIKIDLGDRQVDGVQIRIDPYVDDPARSRFEKFAPKYYVLTLSEAVPGGIWRLHSELRDPEQDEPLLISETLTFVPGS